MEEGENTRAAARHAALVLIAGEVAADLTGGSPRHLLAVHEAAHCTMRLALGDDPLKMEILLGQGGGMVTLNDPGISEEHIPFARSDESKLDAVNLLLVESGSAALDLAELRNEAATILKRHWTLVQIIASKLEQRLAKSTNETARMTGDEIACTQLLHERRSEVERQDLKGDLT